MKNDDRFEALSRICLNNWHYIKHKVLSFHDGVNFLTGHSGSGKSTVIDALQVVLYANTDGRGFFNKAAADDSDRNLIEYLRGMVNIEENNEFAYLRNSNFSTTIALELRTTDTDEYQCVGVVFDVETSTNEISRLFFWHKGALPEHNYQTENRTMSIQEMKEFMSGKFSKEDYYYGNHNERFRKQLYDIYLGGLDAEKFPLLFKRAIPFRMNIKLEDFVKEYICMEQNINIDDMRESVMQYGMMRKKIEDAVREIEKLQEICTQYDKVKEIQNEIKKHQYFIQKMDILQEREKAENFQNRILQTEHNIEQLRKREQELVDDIASSTAQSDELLKQIAATGYDQLVEQMKSLEALIKRLTGSSERWKATGEALKAWEELDITSNPTAWMISDFNEQTISEEDLSNLKKAFEQMREELEEQRTEAKSKIRLLEKESLKTEEELTQLKLGNKAYPKELEEARRILTNRIYDETGSSVTIDILADLMDIRDDAWRNAVEGYMGNNKLTLIVEPKFAKTVMKYYRELDKNKYYRVSVLDTEKVMQENHVVFDGSLSEEVIVKKDYVQAYIHFMLGKVMKCEDIEELRNSKIGITKDCVLYHSYRIQHINPENYTKFAYIGKNSMRNRIKLLEENLEQLSAERTPYEKQREECEKLLRFEALSQNVEVYVEWKHDIEELSEKQEEYRKLEEKRKVLEAKNVKELEAERVRISEHMKSQNEHLDLTKKNLNDQERNITFFKDSFLQTNELLVNKEREFVECSEYEGAFAEVIAKQPQRKYEQLMSKYGNQVVTFEETKTAEKSRLYELRMNYLRIYINRNFSPTAEDNKDYEALLQNLSCERLEEYKQRATEQAKAAVIHFKDDFMYKIRSAIKEALQRKDELNRIISKLDFGKDKYQFYIGKNKGVDGQYYDMFMDEALDVNPSKLGLDMQNQMNLFTMEHEEHYKTMINDLMNIFIPPENATPEELEEAKRNMDKYADYRTYLSFDMQQIISNEEGTIKIQLSKMIKKNSGGEGQNPLYVALLASFAQAYRIGLNPKIRRPATLRLVVLDEAFSKMDAEKVASCIQLMRGLGFQAIISATNDKIQNYLETVDKIFVFANPNKKCISIQEFEKTEFQELARDIEDDEELMLEDHNEV